MLEQFDEDTIDQQSDNQSSSWQVQSLLYPLNIVIVNATTIKYRKQDLIVKISNKKLKSHVKSNKVKKSEDGNQWVFNNHTLQMDVALGHELKFELLAAARIGSPEIIGKAVINLALPEDGAMNLKIRKGKKAKGDLNIILEWRLKQNTPDFISPRHKHSSIRKLVSSSQNPFRFSLRDSAIKKKVCSEDKQEKSISQEGNSPRENVRIVKNPINESDKNDGVQILSSDYSTLMAHDIAMMRANGHVAFSKYNSNSIFEVFLGVDTSFLSQSIAESLGLDGNKLLHCVLSFEDSEYYLEKIPSVKFYQWEEKHRNNNSMWTKPAFAWTLQAAVTNKIQNIWEKVTKVSKKTLEICKQLDKRVTPLRSILEMELEENFTLNVAMKKAKRDIGEAATLMLEDESRQQIVKEARAELKKVSNSMPEGSFLLMEVVKCIRDTLENCTKFCPICFKQHDQQFIRPLACDNNEQCQAQFLQSGLGLNLESEILNNPEVVDLLISCTIAAIKGKHFYPFPKDIKFEKSSTSIFQFDEKKPQKIEDLLQSLPSLNNMQELIRQDKFKKTLDAKHPLLYSLLSWIINTNNWHLRYINDSSERVSGILTPHQFVVRSLIPEREKKFCNSRRKNKTFIAFFGPNFSYWHSLLRNCEKQSDSKNSESQTTFNLSFHTEKVFSSITPGVAWTKSMFTSSDPTFKILSLYESIDQTEDKAKSHSRKSREVSVKDNNTIPRYLFLYPSNCPNPGTINSQPTNYMLESHYDLEHDIDSTDNENSESNMGSASGGSSKEQRKIKTKKRSDSLTIGRVNNKPKHKDRRSMTVRHPKDNRKEENSSRKKKGKENKNCKKQEKKNIKIESSGESCSDEVV